MWTLRRPSAELVEGLLECQRHFSFSYPEVGATRGKLPARYDVDRNRVRLGEVTDFIDVGDFPTFNVADASISTSIVAVLIFFATQELGSKPPDPAAHSQSASASDD